MTGTKMSLEEADEQFADGDIDVTWDGWVEGIYDEFLEPIVEKEKRMFDD